MTSYYHRGISSQRYHHNLSRKLVSGRRSDSHNVNDKILLPVASKTTLSQLISEHKFEAAIQWAEEHTEEVEIWISKNVSKGKTTFNNHNNGNNYSRWHYQSRRRQQRRSGRRGSWPKDEFVSDDTCYKECLQLPIHQACALLAWDHQDKLALEDLIVTLSSIYPEACHHRDMDGVLPLHRILPYRPSIELIVQMIASYPDALSDELNGSIQDIMIWTSRNDNDDNDDSYSSQVWDLLHQGQQILQQTRHEAGLRFLLGVQGLGLKDFTRGETTATTSNALLRSAYLRLAFPNLEQQHSTTTNNNNISDDSAASLSVDAATHRTDLQSLEDLLRDLLTRNEAYTDVLLNLSQERMMQHSHHHIHESYALQDEISDLKKHIRDLEVILRDHGIDKDGNKYSSALDTGEMMSVMGMDPEKPSALTKYMETKVTELQEEYEELEEENEQLTARVEELQSMLNNLERKHLESSLHSSSDIESVRSKVLQLHDAESSSGNSMPALTIHETPVSTPDVSRTGDDDSSGNEYSDLIDQNKAFQAQNEILTKEVEHLRKLLSQAEAKQEPLNSEECLSSSNIQEAGDLRRQLTEMTDIASKREQEAINFEKKLMQTQRDYKLLIEYQEGLQESLGLASAYSHHDNLDDVSSSEGSQGSNEAHQKSSLAEQLKVVDQLSGHQSKDTMEDENISCTTPSSNPSVALSLAHSSIVNSRGDSLLGSEMITSKGSNSLTRSYGNSSSSRTASNGSTTSWNALSLAQQPMKRKGRRQKGLKQLVDILPEGSNMMESFHDSFNDLAKTFFKDDLHAIFKTAAEFYHDFGHTEGAQDGIPKSHSTDSAKPLLRGRKQGKRRFSDGGASPLVLLRKIAKREDAPSNTLKHTALILSADEDLSEIVRRTEGILRCALPVGLVAALQDAVFQLVTRTPSLGRQLHVVAYKILDATLTTSAEGIFGHVIPGSMLLALRTSSQALLDTSQDDGMGIQKMKERLEEEFLDTLIDTSETKLQRLLPLDLVDSLKTAAASFGNLLLESFEDSRYAIRIDFHLLDMLFKKAQRMFGRRFPKEILVALREASFVLQSRLEGTDFVGNLSLKSELNELPTKRDASGFGTSYGQCDHDACSKSVDKGHNSTSAQDISSCDGISESPISKFPFARSNDQSSEAQRLESDHLTARSKETHLIPSKAMLEATKGKGYSTEPIEESKYHMSADWIDPPEDENDDIKSTGNHSSERSLDYITVFYGNSSDEGDDKQNSASNIERRRRSPRRKNRQLAIGKQGSGTSLSVDNSNDSKIAYVRGRSPPRREVLSSSADLETMSRPTLEPNSRRPRSVQPRLDGKASQEFGTDDLDVIFKRAAKEVDASTGSSNMFSRGLSSSSDGSIWASVKPNATSDPFKNIDEILDSLLSDTEETYGIEIADGVVWALKSAVQQYVTEPALLPVIRALHNDDVINQASVFNEGEIPHDLVDAIRSSSLPPGTICNKVRVNFTCFSLNLPFQFRCFNTITSNRAE
jgi:hypothetical protein